MREVLSLLLLALLNRFPYDKHYFEEFCFVFAQASQARISSTTQHSSPRVVCPVSVVSSHVNPNIPLPLSLLDVEVKRLIASNPPSLPPPTIRPNAERVCELLHSAGVHNCRLGKQRQRPTKKASLSYIISRHTQLGRQPSLPTVPFRLLR